MKLSAENIELFTAYKSNELDPNERKDFEDRLKNDQEFSASFEAFQSFEQDITDAEIVAFKAQLKSWDKLADEESTIKTGRVIPIKWISLAASLLILIGVSIFYFLDNTTNQELVAANFEPYDNILTVRGEKLDLDEAAKLYEQESYQAAISLFNDYPENLSATFYKGESYLAIEKYEDAIATFKTVVEQEGIFREVAEFHLALSYLGLDDLPNAKETLLKIQKDSDYFAKAQVLLQALE